MAHTVTLIPGDGIGPEVTQAAVACCRALDVDIQWEVHQAGQTAFVKCGQLLPQETLASIVKNKVALKGPITTPVGKGFRSINVALRQHFDLFTCLRPIKSFVMPTAQYKNIDMVIMRENTEDLYAGIEFGECSDEANGLINTINAISAKKIRADSALSIKPISRFASERIVRFAFNYALRHNRKKVTCVHKANIMKCTDGLFLESFYSVAKHFQGQVLAQDVIVDNLAMQLVLRPADFDILVLPNLYGDIVSDLGAGLIGGLGLAAGANIGDEIAVFEPTHGSAPKYAGLNKVNPVATIMSAALMLKHLGELSSATILERAVRAVIAEAVALTYDLKADRNDPSAVGTDAMTAAIVTKISQLRKEK